MACTSHSTYTDNSSNMSMDLKNWLYLFTAKQYSDSNEIKPAGRTANKIPFMVSYCLRLLFVNYEIVVEGHKTYSMRVKHLNFDGKERKLLVLSGKGQKNAFSSALASL